MAHLPDALRRIAFAVTGDFLQQGTTREHVVVEFAAHFVERVNRAIGRMIKRMDALVDVCQRHSSLGEAIRDRAGWEVGTVLAAVESFLGGSGDYFAVDDQRRGSIVSLGDSVFTFVESRPVCALERNGFSQTAHAQDRKMILVHIAELRSSGDRVRDRRPPWCAGVPRVNREYRE